MSQPDLVYWGSVVAVLGLDYAAAAWLWPVVFSRGAVQHGVREADGYRIGRAVYWRLPGRAAWVIALLALAPLASVLALSGWAAIVALAASGVVSVSLWLIGPPGMKLVYADQTLDDGRLVFVEHAYRPALRSITVLVIFGLAPALALGLPLSALVAGLAAR
jgi:hypothetical protein